MGCLVKVESVPADFPMSQMKTGDVAIVTVPSADAPQLRGGEVVVRGQDEFVFLGKPNRYTVACYAANYRVRHLKPGDVVTITGE